MAHPGGRPPYYNTPEEMETAIEGYFDQNDKVREPPTITGLAFHLGFEDRHALNYYLKEKPEFSTTIKKGKARVEQFLEETLFRNGTVAGIIFNLKNNFGWKDTQNLEHTGADGGPLSIRVKWTS